MEREDKELGNGSVQKNPKTNKILLPRFIMKIFISLFKLIFFVVTLFVVSIVVTFFLTVFFPENVLNALEIFKNLLKIP